MITQSDIQEMADIIARKFDPERIVLFGSYAKDEAVDEGSDVDLLVVKNTSQDLREIAADIMVALWDIPVSKDILVRTQAQLNEARTLKWSVIDKAVKDGKVLYEKAS